MPKRDPNGPIPGFEDEFYGSVGNEKRIRKTHWQGLEVPWVRTPIDEDPDYVRIGPGKYRYIGKNNASKS